MVEWMQEAESRDYQYQGQQVHYQVAGKGYPVILLHGWGCSTKTMEPLLQHLKNQFLVYNVDLPGFGLSAEPLEAWGTLEYAEMLEAFVQEHCQKPPILIAHSFGGRLALRLGAKGIPVKMILTGCAGLKPKRGLNYYTKVYGYKAAKKVLTLPGLGKLREEFLSKPKGSQDYNDATPQMKQVFIKVVNEDLVELLPKITMPVVLYWGELDTATPLEFGKTMEKEMKDAGLIVMPNVGHYAYLECLANFLAVTDSFLKPEQMETV